MHPRPRTLLDPRIAVLLISFACSQVGADCAADDDDSSAEQFCVTVAGGGGFETIQEAVDAAPAGGVISVCSGLFDEDVDIDKPITIAGVEAGGTVITGAGKGTIIEIDQADGPVILSRLSLVSPSDELGTIRGVRITQSSNVTLNEIHIEFEPENNGDSRGLVGVEASQSTVVVNELTTFNIGFSSDTGGTGILAQTNSVLEVHNSQIQASGSFGIHVNESQLSVFNTEIVSTNRPPTAENIDSDGSAIFVEGSGNEEILVEGSTLRNGSFVGIWMQANNLTVTATTIDTFSYGVFMQGDQGSAAGRNLVVSGCTFQGLSNWSVLANSNTTITSSLVDNTGSPGITARAPGGTIVITGNTIEGVVEQGILAGGNTTDGRAESVTVTGNTITNVTAGNGILVLDVVDAVISENVVANIDHAYFRDPGNPGADGSITNGYGIACFRAQNCAYAGNDISNVEFASAVIVGAGFQIEDDVIRDGWWNGIHVEESQGTITGATLSDNRGTAIYLSESTVIGDGVTIENTTRGPLYTELDGEPTLDGVPDPPIDELVMQFNGWGVESRSGGAPAYMEWRNGTFLNTALGGIYSFRGQAIIDGNVMTNTGMTDEVNLSAQGGIAITQGPENMAAPILEITNNSFYGSQGNNLLQLLSVPSILVDNNTMCGGISGALWISNAEATVVNNDFGVDDEANPACENLSWNYAARITGSDLDIIDQGAVFNRNVIEAPLAAYGLRFSGLGSVEVEENTINGGVTAAIEATFSVPTQLFQDHDGDTQSPWSGDCHDGDPAISTLVAEIPDDLIDNDCNPLTPDSTHPDIDDQDQDGVSVADGDCDDTDPNRAPGLPELIGNWIDDNCDGWADTDAIDMPVPELTLLENTITGAGTGVFAQGATVHLTEAETNPVGNVISTTTGSGIELRNWMSQGVVAQGIATLSPTTELIDIGLDCIRTITGDTIATLDGATLTNCGGAGLATLSGGLITATGTVIDGSGGPGVSAASGLVVLDNVLVQEPGGAGIYVAGSGTVDGSNVNITSATGPAVQVLGGTLDLTGGGVESLGVTTVQQTFGTAVLTDVDVLNAATGVHITGGTMTLVDGTIPGATAVGIHGDAGTLTVDGTEITDATGNGISLDSGAAATILDPLLTGNGGWGLSCDGVVTLTACTLTASNNVLGDSEQINGCDAPSNATCGPPLP